VICHLPTLKKEIQNAMSEKQIFAISAGVVLNTGTSVQPKLVDENVYTTIIKNSIGKDYANRVQDAIDEIHNHLLNHPQLIDETGECFLKIEIRIPSREALDINDAVVPIKVNQKLMHKAVPTIVAVEFRKPESFGRSSIVAAYSNGLIKKLFDYFADELCFFESDFIGKTEEEGKAVFTKKDIAYLQS
jgi:hypothetical protein